MPGTGNTTVPFSEEDPSPVRSDARLVPTLVLADLTMIDMDGRAFLTCARELLGSAMPPLVFLTAVEPADRTDLTEEVIAKPCDLDDLLGVVEQHFRT